jgi:aldose 1-epimerase
MTQMGARLRRLFLATAVGVLGLSASTSIAAELSRRSFGNMPDGRPVEAVTLVNRRGVSVTVITYGAALQSVLLPDRNGEKADVVLGHASLAEYFAKREFLGATVGRVANRIAHGQFALDGRTYQVTVNDGRNSLHGGVVGFDKVVWQIVEAGTQQNAAQVLLRHTSPDADQGFPGQLDVTVRYRLDEQNALSIEYRATADRATVVGLSNHAYWNLSGEGSVFGAMDHLLEIPADVYLPVDESLIPTGEFRSVDATPFDFRRPRAIGDRVREAADEQIRFGRGYDHNWVVQHSPSKSTHLMARVTDPRSGRSFELWSDQPGLQFYSGNFLDGTSRGKAGRLYRQGDAIVLEPQAFPDAVNQPKFGSVRLAPGQEYRNTIIYKFGSAATRRDAN